MASRPEFGGLTFTRWRQYLAGANGRNCWPLSLCSGRLAARGACAADAVFVLFAGVESRIGHLLFTAVFATSVVLLLILLKMLDYPFEGALTLSNADFVKTIERVSTTTGAV